MTWRPEVPADFAGETGKIRYRALPYLHGRGLDVGCGPWKVAPHAIGIDGVPHDGPGGPSLCMDCTQYDVFADGSMDFVFSSHFLEHVHHPEQVLKEWMRIIRPGGHLVMYLPHKQHYPNIGQYGANPDHKHDFMPADVIAMMKASGFAWDLLENEERDQDYEYSFYQVYRKRSDAYQMEPWKQPKPAKTACIARPGNIGDVIWTTSIAHQLKKQGYHVTALVEPTGEAVLKESRDVDRVLVFHRGQLYHTEAMAELFNAWRPCFDLFIDFTQSIEANLLYTPSQHAFHWAPEVRRKQANRNYVQFMHEVAQVPYELAQKVYLSVEEQAWATAERAKYKGRVIVLANTGSTWPKLWPYAPAFAVIMATLQVHVVVVGDLKGLQFPASPFTHVKSPADWSIRQSIAFSKLADAVVGQETGLLNAMACEDVAKVVMLGHSTVENLTRDWKRTESLVGNVACYPCHQIHFQEKTCNVDGRTKAAACQSAIKIENAVEALIRLGVLTEQDREFLMKPQTFQKVA